MCSHTTGCAAHERTQAASCAHSPYALQSGGPRIVSGWYPAYGGPPQKLDTARTRSAYWEKTLPTSNKLCADTMRVRVPASVPSLV
eukprot:6813245-Prymnesium_polylepis.1